MRTLRNRLPLIAAAIVCAIALPRPSVASPTGSTLDPRGDRLGFGEYPVSFAAARPNASYQGQLSYSIPFDLPKNRGRAQPRFGLTFVRQHYGVADGWDTSTPCIANDDAEGSIDFAANSRRFVVLVNGSTTKLLSVGATSESGNTIQHFRARNEARTRYDFFVERNVWEVYPLDGTRSIFSPVAGGPTGTHTWCIASTDDSPVVDGAGAINRVEYVWQGLDSFSSAGVDPSALAQLGNRYWLSEIRYLNLSTNANALGPWGTRIVLQYEDADRDRRAFLFGRDMNGDMPFANDVFPRARRIKAVQIKDQQGVVRREARFEYPSTSNHRPIAVIVDAMDGDSSSGTESHTRRIEFDNAAARVPTTPQYDTLLMPVEALNKTLYHTEDQGLGGTITTNVQTVAYFDVDGDGLRDVVDAPQCTRFTSDSNPTLTNTAHVYRGIPKDPFFSGSDIEVNIGRACLNHEIFMPGSSEYDTLLLDWDGDGLMDRLNVKVTSPTGGAIVELARSQRADSQGPHLFSIQSTFALPNGVNALRIEEPLAGGSVTVQDFVDMNGDRRPDLVRPSPSMSGAWDVFLNLGSSLSTTPLRFRVPEDQIHTLAGVPLRGLRAVERGANDPIARQTLGLFDMNGDRLPDLLFSAPFVDSGGFAIQRTVVFLNTGSGFKEEADGGWTTAGGDPNTNPAIELTQGLSCLMQVDNGPGRLRVLQSIIDLNGDGLPDAVSHIYDDTSNSVTIKWARNTGGHFETYATWATVVGDAMLSMTESRCEGPTAGASGFHEANYLLYEIVDLDGDGIPELLQEDGESVVSGFTYGDGTRRLPYDRVFKTSTTLSNGDATTTPEGAIVAIREGVPPLDFLVPNREPNIVRTFEYCPVSNCLERSGYLENTSLGANAFLTGALDSMSCNTTGKGSPRGPVTALLKEVITARGAPAETNRFSYCTPEYDEDLRGFSGFGAVDQIEFARERLVRTHFETDTRRAGSISEIEHDAARVAATAQERKIYHNDVQLAANMDGSSLPVDIWFPVLAWEESTTRDVHIDYSYDHNGSVTQASYRTLSSGEALGTSVDAYAYRGDGRWSAAGHTKHEDFAPDGTLLAREYWYYDSLPFGYVDYGQLHSHETVYDVDAGVEKKWTEYFEYDGFGNNIRVIHERGSRRVNVSEATLYRDPSQTIDEVGNTVELSYVEPYGFPYEASGPERDQSGNAKKYRTTRDGWGRVVETWATNAHGSLTKIGLNDYNDDGTRLGGRTYSYTLPYVSIWWPGSPSETANGQPMCTKRRLVVDGFGREVSSTRFSCQSTESGPVPNIVEKRSWDAFDHELGRTAPYETTSSSYDGNFGTHDALSRTFDGEGRLLSTTDFAGAPVNSVSWDVNSQTSTEAGSIPRSVVRRTDPLGRAVAFEQSGTSAECHRTDIVRDFRGRVRALKRGTCQTPSTAVVAQYDYFLDGTLRASYLGAGAQPARRFLQYDRSGVATHILDARGCDAVNTVDALGRVTQKSYSGCSSSATGVDSEPVSYVYEDASVPYSQGHLTSVSAMSWHRNFSYNIDGSTSYANYYVDTSPQGFGGANGQRVWFDYDDIGREQGMTLGGAPLDTFSGSLRIERDPWWRPKKYFFQPGSPTGVEATLASIAYDRWGQVKTVESATDGFQMNQETSQIGNVDFREFVDLSNGLPVVSELVRQRDSQGRLIEVDDQVLQLRYDWTYDFRGRLTSALSGPIVVGSARHANFGYAYDSGNLGSIPNVSTSDVYGFPTDHSGSRTTYQDYSAGAVTGISDNDTQNPRVETWGRDALGSVTEVNETSGVLFGRSSYQITYDSRGLPVSVVEKGNGELCSGGNLFCRANVFNLYDDNGRPIAITENGVRHLYLGPVAVDGTGRGTLEVELGAVALNVDAQGQVTWHLKGLWGNTTGRFDASTRNWAESSQVLEPFGKRVDEGGATAAFSTSLKGKFGGRSLPFVVNGARLIDTRSGSFTSVDPLLLNDSIAAVDSAGSVDHYGYCTGDPINSDDPDGRHPIRLVPAAFNTLKALYYQIRSADIYVGRNTPEQLELEGKANDAAFLAAGNLVEAFIGGGESPAGLISMLLPSHTIHEMAAKPKGEVKKLFVTYFKAAPEGSDEGDYSGRTSGPDHLSPEQIIANRDDDHHMNEKGFGPAVLDKVSNNPAAIRGREQQNIDRNGGAKRSGGTSGNEINGISPTNPRRDEYLKAASEEFDEIEED